MFYYKCKLDNRNEQLRETIDERSNTKEIILPVTVIEEGSVGRRSQPMTWMLKV